MAAFREVKVRIPETHAARIEKVDGRELGEIVHDLVMKWFYDERRRDIPVKRQGISWSTALYEAMLRHVGQGGVSSYVRESVYLDLSKMEKDLIQVPEWKEGREHLKMKSKRKPASDRLACQAPIIFPAQWIERMDVRYPGKVSESVVGAFRWLILVLMVMSQFSWNVQDAELSTSRSGHGSARMNLGFELRFARSRPSRMCMPPITGHH